MAIIDIEFGKEILQANDPERVHRELLEMEMVMQNSSYGHEYAMLELQEPRSFSEEQEINHRLEEYKQAYFQARQYLQDNHPERLRHLEVDLADQKSKVFKKYTA